MKIKIDGNTYQIKDIKHNLINQTPEGVVFYGETKYLLEDVNNFYAVVFKTYTDGELVYSSGMVSFDGSWNKECEVEVVK